MPVMVLYPSNPEYPGIKLTELFGADEALKALKYVIKHSN